VGFGVRGPTRRCCASNIDDGVHAPYDLLALPGELGVNCPKLEMLHHRFNESTTISYAFGAVVALHSDILRLRNAYQKVREPELMRERSVRASDPAVVRSILDQLLQKDATYQAIEEFRLVCEEAISEQADVQCDGD